MEEELTDLLPSWPGRNVVPPSLHIRSLMNKVPFVRKIQKMLSPADVYHIRQADEISSQVSTIGQMCFINVQHLFELVDALIKKGLTER
jgi:hypothetical protein